MEKPSKPVEIKNAMLLKTNNILNVCLSVNADRCKTHLRSNRPSPVVCIVLKKCARRRIQSTGYLERQMKWSDQGKTIITNGNQSCLSISCLCTYVWFVFACKMRIGAWSAVETTEHHCSTDHFFRKITNYQFAELIVSSSKRIRALKLKIRRPFWIKSVALWNRSSAALSFRDAVCAALSTNFRALPLMINFNCNNHWDKIPHLSTKNVFMRAFFFCIWGFGQNAMDSWYKGWISNFTAMQFSDKRSPCFHNSRTWGAADSHL